MAHMMKHTKASCGHMFAHFDRKAEHISNENLDRTRTHLNYNLATHQQMDQGEFVRQRCAEVRCQNRKDVNVMVSWVVTAPKDLPEAEHKAFFQASYDFLQKRYGRENVVSAYVHMDEVTPHMHFAFVPVIRTFKQDRKNPDISTEVYKVSAKECVNRYDLQGFHESLQRYVSKELGHEVSILNEATKEGNKTITELKKQTAHEEVLKAQQEATKARQMALQEQERIKPLQEKKKALQGEIERLEEVKSRADQTMKRVHETVNQHKPILLDLQKRISEAKAELSVVETAVKEKKTEGADKFGWNGMAERIERARKEAGKDNHIKALEARISLLERFISLPQVKPLWEQFQTLTGRKKPQKDHER